MPKVEVQKKYFNGCGGHSSLLLALVFSMCGQLANALCMFENDEKVQIHMSPQTKSWGTYDGKQLVTASRVFKCQEDSGRYLMISLGAVQWGKNTESKKNYIFDNFEPESCSLENSKSISSRGSLATKANFVRQYKFLRNCIDIHVVDIGGAPLIAKAEQEFCRVEHTGDGSATLHGDMCFLKIRSSNQFAIQPALKKECLDQAYLDQMGIEAQDMFANLNVMVASDDSGISTDVQHIGSRPVQINIAPRTGLLKLSEDIGRGVPQFTTDYNIDSDWGPIRIASDEINLSFLVSNIVDKKCVNGACASTSNYTQPFFGQIELFKLKKNNSPELLDEWWDGGLVPPNWQGFVKGMRYRFAEDVITPGSRYRIVATFQNPADDYAIFLSGLKQMLIRQFSTEGATVGIDRIPALSALRDLGVIPGFGGIAGLASNDQIVELSETIAGLDRIIFSPIWPPYYSSICDNQENCMKIGNKKFHQRLVLEFTVAAPDSSGDSFKVKDIQMRKDSPLYKGYPMQMTDFPDFKCGG